MERKTEGGCGWINLDQERLVGERIALVSILDLDLDNTRRRLCRLLPRCRQRLAPPIAHWGN